MRGFAKNTNADLSQRHIDTDTTKRPHRRANRTDASADRRHKVAPIWVQREAAEHTAGETDRVLELHRRRAVRSLRHRRRIAIAIATAAAAAAAVATGAARS